MKKAFKIIVFVLLAAVCICTGLYFYYQNHNAHNPTNTTDTVSTSKTSKYQNYIDRNSDFAGYIKIDGTDIDYPVVQGTDDEFYLTHNFDKKEEERGAIYMSTESSKSLETFNTVLYGHNWLDTTMFSELVKYDDINFYKQHPLIHFDTAYEDIEWKIFAVFITNADENEDNGYIFNYIYPHLGGDNFDGYIGEIFKRTLYKTNIDIKPDDKILTLSTCYRGMDTNNYRADARIVVLARKVRNGENTNIDTSTAEINPNPKYPEKYCNIMGIKNLYSNDEYWYPYEIQ